MKYSFTIFLLIVISVSHLNIIECYNYYGHSLKMDLNKVINDNSKQEEDASQKEIKDNLNDQEKYCSNNCFFHQGSFILLDNKKFIIPNDVLKMHPDTDTILQPPEFSYLLS
ncbi:MAG: hypothetical protein NTY72_13290 [Bacteroidetes bacterium]|nr:hypothetical protein [Bacteroidota bacterium]